MELSKKMIAGLIIVSITSFAFSFLYYLGNIILLNFKIIPNEDTWILRYKFMDILITAGIFFSILIYIVNMIFTYLFEKVHLKVNRYVLSVFVSFFVAFVFSVSAANDFKIEDGWTVKNIIVIFLVALLLQYLERKIKIL